MTNSEFDANCLLTPKADWTEPSRLARRQVTCRQPSLLKRLLNLFAL